MATKKKIVSLKQLPESKRVVKVEKKDEKKIKAKDSKTKTALPSNKVVQVQKKKKKRSGFILNAILSFLMVIGIVIMCAILFFCGYIVLNAPDFNTDKLYSKDATIFLDRNGEEILRAGAEQREKVTYDDLPEVLVDAIVAAEDSRFFQHNGFDIVRFTKATLGQIAGNDGAGGASTLTMQIAKNAFSKQDDGSIASSGKAGIIRKFNDIYMSVFKIEKNYTKEEIFEMYVNSQFLGWHSYGVEQACQTYFGKSVRDLTLTEAALIAGVFNAPTNYNPFNSTELASQRRSIILNLMVRHGYITEEQKEDAEAISVESLIIDPSIESLSPYQTFIDQVEFDIKKETGYDPYTTPMIVYTTMDRSMQDVMTKLNNSELSYVWNEKKPWLQVAMTIADVKDGSIRAINGGRNQTGARTFNKATQEKRQPGSTAKPFFAYGPFIEYNNGNTGTIFYDNPMTYSNGTPLKNSDGTYLGAMTMRQALARSRNIPAVQAFQAVDNAKIEEFAKACGFKFNTLYESYAIGGGVEVNSLSMSAAYGTLARGGYYIEPYTFTKIVYLETDEVYEHKYEKVQAMSPETAYMLTDILMTAHNQGVGGSFSISGTDIAAKTGTSTFDGYAQQQYGIPWTAAADNWVISYSPDYVISQWFGVYDVGPGKYTDALFGANQGRQIHQAVVKSIYKTGSKFTKPSGVESAKYELETNPAELPSEYTPANLISTELFKKGTEPSEVSSRFSQLSNPTNGEASEGNGQINLSWDPIKTPDAINRNYLQDKYNDFYGQFASTYLTKRYEYNEKNIGTVGYHIYLVNNGVIVEDLGFTTNTFFTYNANQGGEYHFVVKSSYSIFKNNMSSGLNINIKTSSSPIIPGGNEEPSGGNSENSNDDVEVSQ